MGFLKYLVNQVKNPRGLFGKSIAKRMNKGHAVLAEWGLSNMKLKIDIDILDVGCGGGANINNFAKVVTEGKVFGVDYSAASVEVSKEVNKEFINSGRVEIHHSSVSELPFDENTFDLVSGFEAYYFWPDLINDLKEIYRVLKVNGVILLVNEGYKCENEKKRKIVEKWAKLGNFKIHYPDEYKDFLKKAGFSDIQIFEQKEEGWITSIAKKK
jgi:ubiquinone/menaquinone biosynthesis C-methylase UbiE